MNEANGYTKIIEGCLISLLIFTPLALGTVQPWSIFIMRLTVVIALTSWLIKILSQPTAPNEPNKPKEIDELPTLNLQILDLAILAFLGVAAFSTFVVSPYKHKSLDWFTNLTTYTALYFVIVNNIKTESQIKKLIRAMLTAGTVTGVYGILRYFNILDILPHSQDPRISSTYYHASHYAGFLVMVTPLAISYFSFSKSLWKAFVFGLLSALLIANLALSFSITNLAFVISMIFLIIVIFSLREWQVIVKKLIPVIVIFFLFYLFTLVITSPLLSRYTISVRFGQMVNTLTSAINGRIQVWRDGLPVTLSNFYSGWGLGLFSDAFPKFRPSNWVVFLNYAHSDYLQITSDIGIIGLGIYLVLVSIVLKESIKLLKQRYNKVISVGIIVALFASIIRSLWDSNLFIIQSLSVYFFTLIGLLAVIRKEVR